MKRIYIAGFFDARARLRPYRDALNTMGYQVLSTWLDETPLASEQTDSWCALRDLQEIKSSDAFILDTLDENPRGGREVEFGIALTRHIPRYIVGPKRNVFHYLATAQFDTWEDLFGFLDPAGE